QAVCGCGSQDSLPFRPLRDSDLFFPEDREVNLLELALATNIPKGCAETAVRGGPQNIPKISPKWPQNVPWESPKYPQGLRRDRSELGWAGLGCPRLSPEPPQPLSHTFPHLCQVKSVSHDLEQLSRLLQLARSLLQNPFLCLGSYVGSLMGSVLYCVLEPLAASINPLNDHWTLRDYAALLLGRIFW
ncbi:TAF6L factor, partial [Calcarius ornatus]|nr:TAF6L factor [Calcarius ornatus]